MLRTSTLSKFSVVFLFLFLTNCTIGSVYAFLPKIELVDSIEPIEREEEQIFLVKRQDPHRYEIVLDIRYTPQVNEKVYLVSQSEPTFEYYANRSIELDSISEGCEVRYIALDENEDHRRNLWYVGEEYIHTMPQGEIVIDRFSINNNGILALYIEDAIGLQYEIDCDADASEKSAWGGIGEEGDEADKTIVEHDFTIPAVLPETSQGYTQVGLVAGLILFLGGLINSLLAKTKLSR